MFATVVAPSKNKMESTTWLKRMTMMTILIKNFLAKSDHVISSRRCSKKKNILEGIPSKNFFSLILNALKKTCPFLRLQNRTGKVGIKRDIMNLSTIKNAILSKFNGKH